MACARCPYTSRYDILWRDEAEPDVICVMLRCCSGPELRILRAGAVLRSELQTPEGVPNGQAPCRGLPAWPETPEGDLQRLCDRFSRF